MEIKCLAFDVDGTLTNDDKKIDERTKASIFEAREKGIHIVISTGRNKQGCEWIYKELNLEKGNHYLLLINGQEIYDFKNKTYIKDRFIEIDDCFKIEEVAKKYNCLARFTFENEAYFYGSFSSYIREILRKVRNCKKKGSMIKGTTYTYKKVPYKHYEFKKACNKVVFFNDPSFFKKHLKDIQNDLKDFECMMVAGYWMEIMPKGVNKGKALETICDMNDFSMENVMAFGDSQNDISMLEKAGRGVAMGNALKEVKEMADLVTLDNNSNGIGIVIDEKVLGKKIDNL